MKLVAAIAYSLLLLSAPIGATADIRIAFLKTGSLREGGILDSLPSHLARLLGRGYEVGFAEEGSSASPEFLFLTFSLPDGDTASLETKTVDRVRGAKIRFPNSRIVLCLPPLEGGEPGGGDSTRRARATGAVRSAAYMEKVELLDLYTILLDLPDSVMTPEEREAFRAEIISRRLRDHVTMVIDPDVDLISRARLTGEWSSHYGFDCLTFRFEGREAKIARPRRVARGAPWVWRARFWGHAPQTEIALLERGFHIVYCDVAELFGNDEALGVWDTFYRLLPDAGLNRKSTLLGYSRGGIYIYRWALAHPDRVSCIYADAPSLDLKSWPGGKGRGTGNPELWEKFKEDFGLGSEKEAMAFRGNPIDHAEEIARGGYPMLHVCGEADIVVPIEENTDPFERRVRAAGGRITVIRKPGVGHNPHGLRNPRPIVEFILEASGEGGSAQQR
jgi:pimeloyl-ACP methyl ester carboxylesterase